MKKLIKDIVLMVVISCVSLSCSQNKSLQELLQEEKKAIDRFINMNDLVILKKYPENGVFKEKEYFRTSDGLFINVVDSGNGTRVQMLNDVSVRYESMQYIKDVAKGYSTSYIAPPYPFSFVYGIPQTYSSASTPVCQAWVIPLSFVGEEAVLNLIIPSSLGSYTNNSDITPVFYKNLRYTRFN